jgi:hypothetical protein
MHMHITQKQLLLHSVREDIHTRSCDVCITCLTHLTSHIVQAVVEERLSVRLEPVALRLKPPSAQEFHDSLQRLFTEGDTPVY